ncbi:CBS domain-containing protein [Radicibacter daui]|uniref:CBS domain-containing protein n=1 Tax=Radicibacter daui TaxID=3064829 RepID=UPI0040468B34
MTIKRIVPDVIAHKQDLVLVSPEDSVRQTVKRMVERKIGAVLVVDDGRLVGIFTERDVMNRVVGGGRDPADTAIRDVMTADPDYVEPHMPAMTALELMGSRGYRHLPVLDGGDIVGILSVRDLYATIKEHLEEEIKEREAFMFGAGYG